MTLITKNKTAIYASLFSIYIAWGFPFLAFKVTFDYFSPLMVCALRSVLAGLVICVFLIFKPSLRPTKAALKHNLIGGFWFIVVSINLIVWALQFIPSGIGALLTSSIPIWVFLIQWIQGKANINSKIISGLLIGFLGLAWLVGNELLKTMDLKALIGCLCVCLGNMAWAWGVLHNQKQPDDSNPIISTGVQFLFGGLISILISFLFEDVKATLHLPFDAQLGFFYLAFIDVIICFTSYNYLIKRIEPVIVTMHAYVNPIIAVIAGWYILNESIGWHMLGASILILIGVYLVEKGYNPELKKNIA